MKQMADKKRSERVFSVGDEVYLNLGPQHLKALSQQPISKLNPRYYGPFPIVEKIGTVAYKLLLLEDTQIHPMFHVSLLKEAIGTQSHNTSLPLMNRTDQQDAVPATILDKRVVRRHGAPLIQVLVKWSSLHEDNNTWEYLPYLLRQFLNSASLLHIS